MDAYNIYTVPIPFAPAHSTLWDIQQTLYLQHGLQFYRNPGLPNAIYTKKLCSIEKYMTEEPQAESTKVREQWTELNSVMSSGDIMEAYLNQGLLVSRPIY